LAAHLGARFSISQLVPAAERLFIVLDWFSSDHKVSDRWRCPLALSGPFSGVNM